MTRTRPRPHVNSAAQWAAQILVLLFGYTTLGWTYVVPTGSMETTLMVGDHLLVDHLVYAPPGSLTRPLLPYSDVQRGDIVVFRYPPDPRQNYVKRVIGVPGDRVRVLGKDVWVNGRRLHEPYKRLLPVPGLEQPELEIPEAHYFVLGDNRDNSADSRVWGLVPRANIVGKPILVFWSYEAATEQLTNRTHWLDVPLHFFSKTRWSRMLRPVRSYPPLFTN